MAKRTIEWTPEMLAKIKHCPPATREVMLAGEAAEEFRMCTKEMRRTKRNSEGEE